MRTNTDQIESKPTLTHLLTNELIEDLLDPSMSAFTMCKIHGLSLTELADLLESQTYSNLTADLDRISNARIKLIEPEARALATARLADQLKDKPTTPAHAETQRKAANTVLSTSKSMSRRESRLGSHSQEEQRHQPSNNRPEIHIARKVSPGQHPSDPTPNRQHSQKPPSVWDQRREHQAPAKGNRRVRRGQPKVRSVTEPRKHRPEVIPTALKNPILNRTLTHNHQLEQLGNPARCKSTQKHRGSPVPIPIIKNEHHPNRRPSPQEPKHTKRPIPIRRFKSWIFSRIKKMQQRQIQKREHNKANKNHRNHAQPNHPSAFLLNG